MTTAKQAAANRKNAKKSTGPKTDTGKAALLEERDKAWRSDPQRRVVG